MDQIIKKNFKLRYLSVCLSVSFLFAFCPLKLFQVCHRSHLICWTARFWQVLAGVLTSNFIIQLGFFSLADQCHTQVYQEDYKIMTNSKIKITWKKAMTSKWGHPRKSRRPQKWRLHKNKDNLDGMMQVQMFWCRFVELASDLQAPS